MGGGCCWNAGCWWGKCCWLSTDPWSIGRGAAIAVPAMAARAAAKRETDVNFIIIERPALNVGVWYDAPLYSSKATT